MTKGDWCKAHGILPVQYAALEMTLGNLSDIELATQYNAVTAGFDPSELQGFAAIEHLYRKDDDGLRMRPEEIEIFGQVVASRMSGLS